MQYEEYFLNIYHLSIKNKFFKGKYNIKEEYYLCGHSLGGFFESRYLLKYPKGIKKVLLLSPARITDYRIPGTNMYKETSIKIYFLTICCPTLFWPYHLKIQNMYRCYCYHNFIKKYYGTYTFNFDENEIRNNIDCSTFTLDYPDDLYECEYYLFDLPPPAAYLPIESNTGKLIQNKLYLFLEKSIGWKNQDLIDFLIIIRKNTNFFLFIILGILLQWKIQKN